ncbi:MAG TPA: hypothetical protein VGS08_01440 [Candidatus Saccharimonadales bacterium]|nr:hypothetical protein [Candidatus Saccharimonadales bacterium]
MNFVLGIAFVFGGLVTFGCTVIGGLTDVLGVGLVAVGVVGVVLTAGGGVFVFGVEDEDDELGVGVGVGPGLLGGGCTGAVTVIVPLPFMQPELGQVP